MKKFADYAVAAILPLAFAASLSIGSAFAAGEGSNTTTTAKPPECKEGEVWDPEAPRFFGKGKCVTEAEFKARTEEEKQTLIYDYGKSFARAGDYERAISVLYTAPDQNDPRVLNYLGYSHRKLGRMDEALTYYQAAIAQNPDFSLVREYLGEAYVQLGLLEKAREQLSEIERICGGRSCGEYGQLATLIVDSQTAQ